MLYLLFVFACTHRIVDSIVRTYVDYSSWNDGNIHVLFGGTGTLSSDTRAGASVAIVINSELFLFDVGPGSTRKLLQMNTPIHWTQNIFISHLHSDHYGDFGEFSIATEIFGRQKSLTVYGPAGTAQMVEGFAMAYRQDHDFRKEQHPGFLQTELSLHNAIELHNNSQLNTDVIQLSSDEATLVFEQNDVKVSALLVQHEPVTPAIAYRLDYKNRSIVISGDTAYEPKLASFSKDADILIHEAMDKEFARVVSESFEKQGGHRKAEMILESMSNHSTPQEAGEIAQIASAKNLVLTHISPPLVLPKVKRDFRKKAEGTFSGKVTIAEDGLHLTLSVLD
jgi:ribonuclease Z